MRQPFFILLGLTAVAAACERRPNEAEQRQLAGRVLQGTLAYPNSALLGVVAGSDAAELRFATPDSARRVADWFRQALPLNHWDLESDAVTPDGSLVIYAKQGSRPLWITLTANRGGPGTTYTMIGAVVEGDSIR